MCAWDGELAYGQLDEFSERLAHDLIEAGVTQGMIVPLCFEKSMWTVVGLLAVLKTGAAFTFLDAETQPEARLRTIVEQAHASVICSSVAQTNLSQRLGGKVIVVGPSLGLSRQQSRASTIMPRVDPSSPLYLVFTSGSTGQPKGAILPHKSFASALHYQLGPLNLTKHSRVYDFASYSFDVAVHNALATLAVGGCLCVPSDNDRKTRLAESIKEMEVNFANLTSSVSRLIEPHEVPTLATLTLGGEPVIQDDAERWWGKVKVINSCGPAECTPMSVINSFASSPAEVRWIGLGTGNLTWIVDPGDHNILLPVGQAGELMLEGPLIGYGYLNDTVKTAAAFVDDPTWLVAGAPGHPGRSGRLYKTGDLVRYNQDGSLQILGRKDTQVKVRGQRVELEEVEHHLRRFLPEAKIVAETVTIAETSSAILAAFFCLEAVSESQAQTSTHKNAAAVDQAAIKTISSLATRLGDEMSKCLPPYMVPSIYVPVAAMPMTATDKTDRKRLRALAASLSREQLDQMRGLLATSKRMPETELERQLQSLWARILKIPNDKIGLDDGFFRLGGDSITAMHLVGEARKLGILFSVADIFKEQSITKLIERQQFNGYKSEIVDTLPPPPAPFSLVDTPTKIGVISSLLSLSPKMQSTNISDIFPLTDFQTQSISRGIALPAVARNYFWLDFGASTVVNRERLRKSCHSLLNHYPLLRSVFVPFQKAFWQVVLWQCEVPLSEISVKADMDRACETICTKDLQSQVTAGTLPTSFILVRNQHHHYRLIIRLSHAQYDGVSLAVISQSLADFYHGRQVSATPDFSAYLAHLMNEHTRSGVYWKQHLSGSRNTQVASRISRGVVYEKVPRRIQAEGSNKLPQLADGVSVASLIGSAWAIVLSLITGQDDVMFGHLVADREAAVLGIQNIVGPCLNIIPIRIKILREQTNTTAILHSVHEQLLSLRQTGLMMGWEDIIKSCTDWPEGSTLESVVQHQNIDEHPKIQFGDTNTRLQWFDNPNLVPAALSIISYPEGSKLRVQILASSHMLTSETAGLLVACLCDTIDVLTRCQDKPIPASFLDNLQMAVRPLS